MSVLLHQVPYELDVVIFPRPLLSVETSAILRIRPSLDFCTDVVNLADGQPFVLVHLVHKLLDFLG